MALGLPPVSVGLKAIAPFLHRAEELVEREPVIAYWCAYYAAQLGISVKAKDSPSRTLLFDLLTALERLKKEIGPNDAVDMEAASAAYVENFALKIFKIADDEDRAGKATKSTAKKFLAASNFFEVLKVFPQSELSEAIDTKIKYAKWKAADIAKAIREGRKPTPGTAESEVDPGLAASHPPVPLQPPTPPKASTPIPQPSTTPPRAVREPSPPTSVSRSPKRQPSPPQVPGAAIARDSSLSMRGEGKRDEVAGFRRKPSPPMPSYEHVPNPTPRPSEGWGGSNVARAAWVSRETEGAKSDEERERDPYLNVGSGRGASAVDFDYPASSSPPREYIASGPAVSCSPPRGRATRSSSPTITDLPPGFVPSGPPIPTSTPSTPGARLDLLHTAPPPPPPPPLLGPVAPVFELTSSMIAKAQKHCKFAISSLDYEDVQQARMELRAALDILGG